MENTEQQQELIIDVSSQEQEETVMETNRELSITEGIEGEPTCDEDSRKTHAEEDAGVDPSGEDTSLTTQWSVEDEEEAARERRRRQREEQLRKESENGVPADSTATEFERVTDEDKFSYKTSGHNELEEDEGFGDWTQRLDRQRQKQLEEHVFEAHHNGDENQEAVCTQRAQVDYLEQEEARYTHHPAGLESEETVDSQYSQKEEAQDADDDVWTNSHDEKCEKNENILEFSSDIHLQREMRSSSLSQDEDDGFREAEAKLEKIRKSLEEKGNQEFEHLKQKQMEAEAELEELKKRREERRHLREKVEYQRQQEELERQERQEEEKQRMKEDIERRRMEATEKRMKKLSTSGSEGEELLRPISPRSPTSKITERTEHLNRSIKKSSSIKKTHPVVPIAKIEDKLEQYTHAVETSSKGMKHTSMDIPSVIEPVAAKKNLFETPDALANVPKASPCKDTEGLNVGVAGRINQWVKETSDTNVKYPATAASDIMPGDVGSIKNLWEHKGDSPSSKTSGSATKSTPGNKKYKYVPTGHGKYEKMALED
ncbi:non-muscle caldesmon-like isoform X2 [Protopterus annectens]|uniref:non-muscle caldesmon-like isoform X2 n=1 Tax=Protopterus annectens TaxID=7888 RepID=UPI001CFA4EF8|nr:non-muscle caldesmon-like isoform X2 [Protopterus annectens]